MSVEDEGRRESDETVASLLDRVAHDVAKRLDRTARNIDLRQPLSASVAGMLRRDVFESRLADQLTRLVDELMASGADASVLEALRGSSSRLAALRPTDDPSRVVSEAVAIAEALRAAVRAHRPAEEGEA